MSSNKQVKTIKTIDDILAGFDERFGYLATFNSYVGDSLDRRISKYIRKEIEELLDELEISENDPIYIGDFETGAGDNFRNGWNEAVDMLRQKLSEVRGEEKEDGG